MILALGKLGGDEARAVLAGIEARSEAEAEALRKARDRVSGPAVGFSWRGEAPMFASVPVGLEDVAIAEAGQRDIRPARDSSQWRRVRADFDAFTISAFSSPRGRRERLRRR